MEPQSDIATLRPVASWAGDAVAVDPRQVLRVHRYTDPDKVRPAIREAAERVTAEVAGLAEPVARYRRVAIEACADGELRLEGGVRFRCEAFGRLLAGCVEVLAFVLTLGPKIDNKVIALMEEFEPLDALFFEASGWLAIEAATRCLGRDLRDELAPAGLRLSNRMGPGYSYRRDFGRDTGRVEWPLEQQTELFRLFDGAELPVELLTSCAMRPKMSRSGLFGVLAASPS